VPIRKDSETSTPGLEKNVGTVSFTGIVRESLPLQVDSSGTSKVSVIFTVTLPTKQGSTGGDELEELDEDEDDDDEPQQSQCPMLVIVVFMRRFHRRAAPISSFS
jgi:hypothetical protein